MHKKISVIEIKIFIKIYVIINGTKMRQPMWSNGLAHESVTSMLRNIMWRRCEWSESETNEQISDLSGAIRYRCKIGKATKS